MIFLSFTSPFVCLEINNLCTSTLNGDEGWPEVWPIDGMRRGRLSSGELLAGSLDICLSYIAGLSVTYRWYCMQSRLKGASSGVVGDGHWLGSLPGWYASICVKLLFLLAIFTLHFQFAFPLISSSYSISATLPWKLQHGYLSIDFNSPKKTNGEIIDSLGKSGRSMHGPNAPPWKGCFWEQSEAFDCFMEL